MKRSTIKNILALFVLVLVVYDYLNKQGFSLSSLTSDKHQIELAMKEGPSDSTDRLMHAIDNQLSDVQVSSSGIVSKMLSDDLSGSRHQRFILKLDDNRTILVAHNIDLAPKISSLRNGDQVRFYGEYEWNNRGGVVHWTHRDPGGRHTDGWLEHEGKRYQ